MVGIGVDVDCKGVPAVSAAVDVLTGTQAVLLDFDGPVCGVFSGRPNYVVAGQLRTFLEQRGIKLPGHFAYSRDPLKLLQWIGREYPSVVAQADDVLSAEETLAVESARPTPGAHDLLGQLATAGVPVAIVTNNSAAAVGAYLRLHDLSRDVAAVAARPPGRPERMKPAPDALLRAMDDLGVQAAGCIFVGDSPSDVEAAQAAGVRSVGYAKSDRHRTALEAAGADLILDDMAALGAGLQAAA